jgi:hypothetical protein
MCAVYFSFVYFYSAESCFLRLCQKPAVDYFSFISYSVTVLTHSFVNVLHLRVRGKNEIPCLWLKTLQLDVVTLLSHVLLNSVILLQNECLNLNRKFWEKLMMTFFF